MKQIQNLKSKDKTLDSEKILLVYHVYEKKVRSHCVERKACKTLEYAINVSSFSRN